MLNAIISHHWKSLGLTRAQEAFMIKGIDYMASYYESCFDSQEKLGKAIQRSIIHNSENVLLAEPKNWDHISTMWLIYWSFINFCNIPGVLFE